MEKVDKKKRKKRKKMIVAKVYSLTPKAKRTSMALKKYDEELERLKQFSDEEIEEMFERFMEPHPSARESEGMAFFIELIKQVYKIMEEGWV